MRLPDVPTDVFYTDGVIGQGLPPSLPTSLQEPVMDKFRERRQDKMIESVPHDPYLTRRHAGTAQCPGCGATCLEGRWSWQAPDTNGQVPEATPCPACRRIADNMPAGTLTLSGDFVGNHHDEIMNLIRNTEEKEKSGHALERIMQCNKTPDGLVVTTTGMHLATRIGHALAAAYKGHTEYQYSDSEAHVRVNWLRN